jgi:hypothetical protein
MLSFKKCYLNLTGLNNESCHFFSDERSIFRVVSGKYAHFCAQIFV